MRTITTADGLVREYRIHIPASYDPAQPTPLVLNFPGTHDSVQRQLETTRTEDLADIEGFIAVVPVGYEESDHAAGDDRGPGEQHFTWNTGASPDLVDDSAFIDQLLDQLEGDACIDLDQVFTMGMSGGAAMGALVVCVMPDRIAAVASVAGFIDSAACIDRPPAVVFLGDDDYGFAFSQMNVDLWAASAGCSAAPDLTSISVDFEVELRSFTGCDDNGAVDLYVIEGGGHRWPGDTASLPQAWQDCCMPPACETNGFPCLGVTTLDIDATAVAWDFFQDHPIA